ncbi:helix-turn-helix transcriptional regulator [Stenotrophomonas acidaminiphila]|uniref:helix-turn-helix transcriptional regulator n=1 Tax=Stenotrophomonas acidaminiphila TaxID=128780 RepID=UPI0015FCF7D9|nr:helix-turn-helix transcriptional regulator [Stenotrophomonas acidaminiphila]
MAALKTPADLGNVIQQRRKALGWDQARLAHEAGVSRQWVIEIEKGKPRAELQLVLRTLNALGIELDASTRNTPSPPGIGTPTLTLPNIDWIVENSRSALPHAGTAGQPSLSRLTRPQSAALDAARESQSAVQAAYEQLRNLSRPQSAVEKAREQLMTLPSSRSAVQAAYEQLRNLSRPQSAVEKAREQLMNPTWPQSAMAAAQELKGGGSGTARERKQKPSVAKKPKGTPTGRK